MLEQERRGLTEPSSSSGSGPGLWHTSAGELEPVCKPPASKTPAPCSVSLGGPLDPTKKNRNFLEHLKERIQYRELVALAMEKLRSQTSGVEGLRKHRQEVASPPELEGQRGARVGESLSVQAAPPLRQ